MIKLKNFIKENTGSNLIQKYDLNHKEIDYEDQVLTKIRISDITISKKSLYGAIRDVKQGRGSKTDEPICVLYDAGAKKFIITDGWHRLAQLFIDKKINKNTLIDVYLVSTMYNGDWAIPYGDDVFNF